MIQQSCKHFVVCLFAVLCMHHTWAQDFKNKELFTTPKTYAAAHIGVPMKIEGKADESVWNLASWSDTYVDIEGRLKPLPTWDTRMKMLWDDQYLYIYAELIEPNIWATLEDYDEIIYFDNDFEVFINPDGSAHRYFEFEINALGTMFDLFMPKPYRNESNCLIAWNSENLKYAVNLHGTLNDPSDIDSMWTVEMAIPFESVHMGVFNKGPQQGDIWRINFSRVQWDLDVVDGGYHKRINPKTGKHFPEHNWVWSPQGVINMHYPERWGYLLFAENGDEQVEVDSDKFDELWRLYYMQKDFHNKHKQYADNLNLLYSLYEVEGQGAQCNCRLSMNANTSQFKLLADYGEESWSLDHFGELKRLSKED